MEEINALIKTHAVLFFISEFLHDHPEAELYLVGGSVRDLLLKRRGLNTDFDFVIRKLQREKLESWFSKQGSIDLVGRVFGVYKFLPRGFDSTHTTQIDIALPRTEFARAGSHGGYKEFDVQSDAELSIEKDLSRRDFTINAMAINIRTGELVDLYGGTVDLEKKLVRAVGNPTERFQEDFSRMLRAIRFACELHFDIEPETRRALQEQIPHIQDRCTINEKEEFVVPRETIGSELAKAFARNPEGAKEWLKKTNAFNILFNVPLSEIGIKHLAPGNPTIPVALLLHELTPQKAVEQLHLTGLDTLPHQSPLRIDPQLVSWLIIRLQQPWEEKVIRELRASLFEKTFLAGQRSEFLLSALRALGKTTILVAVQKRTNEILERWKTELNEPIPPLLSGDDLLHAGIPAGPRIRSLLEELRDEQLDGRILTRETAKKWLKEKKPI